VNNGTEVLVTIIVSVWNREYDNFQLLVVQFVTAVLVNVSVGVWN
jgi:hypothetical protein